MYLEKQWKNKKRVRVQEFITMNTCLKRKAIWPTYESWHLIISMSKKGQKNLSLMLSHKIWSIVILSIIYSEPAYANSTHIWSVSQKNCLSVLNQRFSTGLLRDNPSPLKDKLRPKLKKMLNFTNVFNVHNTSVTALLKLFSHFKP